MCTVIRSLLPSDWPAVRAIYEEGIATGDATFQTEAPAWELWDAGHLPTCRLVLVSNGAVVGWAALSLVSSRCVYAGVAEVSMYVAAGQRGAGVGRQLLQALVAESEQEGIWTLQAGIFPETWEALPCTAVRVTSRFAKLGQMHGRWRDVLRSNGARSRGRSMKTIFHITTHKNHAPATKGFLVHASAHVCR